MRRHSSAQVWWAQQPSSLDRQRQLLPAGRLLSAQCMAMPKADSHHSRSRDQNMTVVLRGIAAVDRAKLTAYLFVV
jgi:hypothetical protein